MVVLIYLKLRLWTYARTDRASKVAMNQIEGRLSDLIKQRQSILTDSLKWK